MSCVLKGVGIVVHCELGEKIWLVLSEQTNILTVVSGEVWLCEIGWFCIIGECN